MGDGAVCGAAGASTLDELVPDGLLGRSKDDGEWLPPPPEPPPCVPPPPGMPPPCGPEPPLGEPPVSGLEPPPCGLEPPLGLPERSPEKAVLWLSGACPPLGDPVDPPPEWLLEPGPSGEE
ncbi:hypothetical protein ACWEV3_02335, partial [Saccharopolyspora sp. NPDC003752]